VDNVLKVDSEEGGEREKGLDDMLPVLEVEGNILIFNVAKYRGLPPLIQ